jgi:CheY-like chemotaxis protein
VPVTILVAEDSVTMRHIMEMTFAGENAKVTTVESGEAAVAKASELQPDVVFADLSMSGMDGYAVAREIKSKPALAKTAVIVMASQKGPYDEGKGKAAGVDDHIVKPFDSQFVIDKVKQVLAKPRVAVGTGAVAMPVRAAAAPVVAAVPKATTQQLVSPPASNVGAVAGAKPRPVAATGGAAPAVVRKATQVAMPPPPDKAAEEHKPAAPAAPVPVAPAPAAPVAIPAAAQSDLESKLRAAGLKPEQVEAVLTISREVVERVVWEVVPELAETIIREEIKRLTSA